METVKEAEKGLKKKIRDKNVLEEEGARGRTIIRTSIIGILANVFLATFKAVVGIMSHSIAIVLDAVNNLSDAASSLITIVGTKLAGKEPDRDHPFGHGRVEYLSAMVISVIVLYAGLTSFVESVKKIITPDVPDYSTAALVIVASGVVVKLLLGRYVKSVGERVNSDSLVNSGEDARLDAVISASTLAAAVVYLWKGISLEAWLGAVISLVIIKAGIEMLRETISKVLGERADADLARAIRATVTSFPGVRGAYDLILHNYGPDTFNGSIHIEVPDTTSAEELDTLTREITAAVYKKHQVILTAISVYSLNTRDEHAVRMRERVMEAVLKHEHVLEVHGFHVDEKTKTIRFDAVVSFDAKDREKVHEEIAAKVKEMYPDYRTEIFLDTDFSLS